MNIEVSPSGKLAFDGKEYRCALGKGGILENKKEGDGATPAGCFPMREVFYRADRVSQPQTILQARALKENDGWCDDPGDSQYNKLVSLPYPASVENLWRGDNIYDIIVPLGYNDDPPVPAKGSAIFMHVARENYAPTAGCIALSLPDLLEILSKIDKDTLVCVKN
ncbi:MAG: L,D-transpeptidase family protein [Candidatus Sungbacteria bacterium]|nr:L,D-transpeptidase family protein [Candidatus Sungbacteria bacterium]